MLYTCPLAALSNSAQATETPPEAPVKLVTKQDKRKFLSFEPSLILALHPADPTNLSQPSLHIRSLSLFQ